MPTVADALADWNGGGTLNAPDPSAPAVHESGLNFGTVFVVGLLVASAIGGIVEYRKHR